MDIESGINSIKPLFFVVFIISYVRNCKGIFAFSNIAHIILINCIDKLSCLKSSSALAINDFIQCEGKFLY